MPKRPEPIPPLPLSGSKSGGRYVSPPSATPGRVLPPGTPTRFSDTQVLLEELLAITSNIALLPLSLADKIELLESALFKAAHTSLMTKFETYMRDKHHGLDPTKTSPAQAGMDASRRGSQGRGLNTIGGYPTTATPPDYFPDWSPGGMGDPMGPKSIEDESAKARADAQKRQEELKSQETKLKNQLEVVEEQIRLASIDSADARTNWVLAKTRNKQDAYDAMVAAHDRQLAKVDKKERLEQQLDNVRKALNDGASKPDNILPGGGNSGILHWVLLWLLSPVAFHDVLEHVAQTANQSWRKDPTPLDAFTNPGPLPRTDIGPKLWSEAKTPPMSGVPPLIVQRYITDPPKGSDDIPRGVQGPTPTPAPFTIPRGVK